MDMHGLGEGERLIETLRSIAGRKHVLTVEYIAPASAVDPRGVGLKASFDYYRAIDQSISQYRRRKEGKISVPVLAFSGTLACGPMVENELPAVAANVESVIIPDCGHYPAEEKPEALLAALQGFFLSYQ